MSGAAALPSSPGAVHPPRGGGDVAEGGGADGVELRELVVGSFVDAVLEGLCILFCSPWRGGAEVVVEWERGRC